MEEITLKNGGRVAVVSIAPIMINLKALAAENFIAVYELFELCRNPTHQLFGNSAEVLKRYGLLGDNNTVHDNVRDIVLSSVTINENEFTCRIGDPR